MDNDTKSDALPVTTAAEAPTEGMTESMSVEQFAQFMVASDAKAKKAATEPEKEPEATEETTEEGKTEAEETPEQSEEAEPEKEQSDEEPKTEDDEEVLSQPKTNDPDKLKKWQENVQKRINSVTAKRKEAEAKAAALEAENATLKEQQGTQNATNDTPITVTVSDPSDETQAALSESDLNKLTSDSESALNLIERSRGAILRAMAKDEPTVKIGEESYQVEEVLALEQKARRHLEKLIPQRRQFLKAKEQADSQAKGMYPALFDKKTSEYQQFEAFARQFPAVSQLPSARLLYGLAMDKLNDLKKPKAEAKKVETPKKASTDTTTSTAASRSKNTGGEKAQLVKQLEKAEKDFSSNRSTESYARVLTLQEQLKRLT